MPTTFPVEPKTKIANFIFYGYSKYDSKITGRVKSTQL